MREILWPRDLTLEIMDFHVAFLSADVGYHARLIDDNGAL
jgi:hypothetical protein